MKTFLKLALFAAAAQLAACSTVPPEFANAPIYTGGANSASNSRVVTVTSVQLVQIKTQPSNASQVMGRAAGALLGGVMGNSVGNGRGRMIATGVGAIAGDAVAQGIQDVGSLEAGIEYTIVYTDESGSSQSKTVVQPYDTTLSRIAPGWKAGGRFAPTKALYSQGPGGDRISPM